MDFNEYQKMAKRTANYPSVGHRIIYPVLGLAGESGEIANKIKKIFRDDNNIITIERKESIKKELGDILWYISQISTELEISLDDVAVSNINKLASRAERGSINGDGDNR
jgi:NTP pyrophosphatase (non-canonical NTP hydrolase)